MEKTTEESKSGVADALLSTDFIQGRQAGLAGKSPSLNPHPPGTPRHQQWDLGLCSGRRDRSYEDAMWCAA